MKRILRLLSLAGAVAGAIWYARQQQSEQVPGPVPATGHRVGRPRLQAVPDRAEHPAPPDQSKRKSARPTTDDLTEIKGIGPAYAKRLAEAGITSFEELAQADTEALSEQFEPRAGIEDWISQAKDRA